MIARIHFAEGNEPDPVRYTLFHKPLGDDPDARVPVPATLFSSIGADDQTAAISHMFRRLLYRLAIGRSYLF